MDRDLYQWIIDVYRQTGSVDQTAALCGTYAIKVRKVLITEGLWRSKKSDAVNALREKGYSAAEIAETLGMDEKNVQFYLPYTDRVLSSDPSGSQARVSEFRERGRKTAEGNLFREEREETEKPVLKRKQEKAASAEEKNIATRKNLAGDWSGYQLHVELVEKDYLSETEDCQTIFAEVPDPAALRSLLKTRGGISRDVIVPGGMSLHQLSYVIQELFGFMNCHLHHFALPKALFQRLTEGEARKWAEMCGVYLHVPAAEDFSDLYWDDDYKQGKSAKAWMRSKYTGEQMNYAVGETYIDSLRLLKEEMDWIEGKGLSFQDLSLEEYAREYAAEGEVNAVLERLKIKDLFWKEKMNPPNTDTWREAMRQDIEVSRCYLEAFRKTKSFRSLEEAMGVLRVMREDRSTLDQAIWRERDEVRKHFGRNPDQVLEETEAEIHRLERQIGGAMHAFDPPDQPITDTLYYHYDYGDGWLFRITCKEIYFRAEEELGEETEKKAALQKAKKQMGHPEPEMDQRLEDCGWGKNYMEEYTFMDFGGWEVHNKFYVPLCDCYLENKPVCVQAEGLPLVEDVGGIGGYFDFIRNIHGEDAEEAASLRVWARSLGWKEIVPKPGKIL